MATIRELFVKLGVKSDTAALEAFDSGLESLKNTAIAVGAAVAATAGVIYGLAQTTANAGDAAAKGAGRTSTTAEEYQRLADAAEKADVATEQFEQALNKQASAAAKANAEGLDYIETQDGVQIAIKNADGSLKNQTELMTETADAVAAATTKQEKLRIAQAVYGEELGAKMLPLLMQGGDAIIAMGDEAEALGKVISNEAAAEAEVFNDALHDLQSILVGVRNILGTAIIPLLTQAAHGVRDWYLANADVIRSGIEKWAQRLADALVAVFLVLQRVDKVVQQTVGWEAIFAAFVATVTALGAVFAGAQVAGAISSIAGAASVLGVTLSGLLPIVAAVGAGAAALAANITIAFLVWEDLFTFLRGGESLIGLFLEKWSESDTILGTVARLFQSIVDVGREIYGVVSPLVGLLGWLGGAAEGPASTGMSILLDILLRFITSGLMPLQFFLEGIVLVLQGVAAGWALVGQAVDAVLPTIESALEAAAGLADIGLGAVGGTLGLDTTAFAPSPGEAQGGAGAQTTNQTTNQNQIIINGGDPDEVRRVVEETMERNNRSAAGATA